MMRVRYLVSFCCLCFLGGVLGLDKTYLAHYSIGNDEFEQLSEVIISQNDQSKMTLKFSEKHMVLSSSKVMDAIIADNSYIVTIVYPDSGIQLKGQISLCEMALSNFHYVFNFGLLKEGDLLSVHLAPYNVKGKNPSLQKYRCDNLKDRKELAASLKDLTVITLKHKAKVFLPKEGFTVPADSVQVSSGIETAGAGLFPDADAKDTEESVESQSFLRRYWYIFLPMFLMSFFGPSPPPEQQQTQPLLIT